MWDYTTRQDLTLNYFILEYQKEDTMDRFIIPAATVIFLSILMLFTFHGLKIEQPNKIACAEIIK